MFNDGELAKLIDLEGVRRMVNGCQVVIRAKWVDQTPQQPHGVDYALILQDERGQRILGFDNSHAFDGAHEEDRWDHEHREGLIGQRFRYDFTSASNLLSEFFDLLDAYCRANGTTSDFIED